MLTAGRWTPVHRHKRWGTELLTPKGKDRGRGVRSSEASTDNRRRTASLKKRKNFRFFDLRVTVLHGSAVWVH